MNKTITTTLAVALVCFGSIQAEAQKRYDFSYSSGAVYTPLDESRAFILVSPADDIGLEDENYPVYIDFQYLNTPVENFVIVEPGLMAFNTTVSEIETGPDALPFQLITMAAEYDVREEREGKILYDTLTVDGEKVLIIEYKNLQVYREGQLDTDTVNFQVWLRSSDNSIEYRVGYHNLPDSCFTNDYDDEEGGYLSAGLITNAGDSISSDFMSKSLQMILGSFPYADSLFPVSDFVTDEEEIFEATALVTYPAMGSVFRFAPAAASARDIRLDIASLYPNPSNDGIYHYTLKEAPSKNAGIRVYDMTGRLVFESAQAEAQGDINLGHMPAGSYLCVITDAHKKGIATLIRK